uniref:Saposin B-type domain-containing protein n=1 Tax=Syphacia muris TaxID=451379 RepID=A0A0N5A8S5_9BILA
MEKIADIIRCCGTCEEVSRRCLKRQNRIADVALPVFVTFDKKKRRLGRKVVYGTSDNIVRFFLSLL